MLIGFQSLRQRTQSFVEWDERCTEFGLGIYRYLPGAAAPAAQLTKYPTTHLRLSYDNAKVTIDLRLTANLQNILRREQGFLRYDSLAKL